MQNFKFLIVFLLIFICISQKDSQQHHDIQCQSQLFENILSNIRIEYIKKIIPDNINEVQIKSILEHLLCEKLKNQQDLSKYRFKGTLPLWLFMNIQNSNFKANSNSNQQENNNSTCQINYLLQSNQEDIDYIYIFDLIINDQDNCIEDLNLSAKVKFEIKYSVIRHIIVCALIIFFQIIQIDKNKNIQKEILDENETRIKIKILSLPLLMQIILDNTFMVTILNEVEAISPADKSFLIYILPILFQAYIMIWFNWVNFVVIFKSNFQENFCCNNSFIVCILLLIIGASNIISIMKFSVFYENNINYQYCIPFIYLLQILYNFRFKKIYFDHKIFFANLSTKVFYVLYVRGFPLKQRDVDQDLQVVYVVGSAFILQLLILYFQHRFGPKKLICLTSKKNVLLKNKIGESECPICRLDLLDEESNLNFSIQKKNVILTNCHHIFHRECLIKWLKVNQSCPICRGLLDDTILE